MVFQMIYYKNVSRKNSTRSITNIIVRVKMVWSQQRESPTTFHDDSGPSFQPWHR